MKRFRKVTFDTKEKDVREFVGDENMDEHAQDVERVTETLVQFFQKTVKENLVHLGQHYKGYENDDKSYDDRFERQYTMISRKVLQNNMHELDGVYETLLDYIDKPTSYMFRSLFKMKNTQLREYQRLRWCAIIVMLAGLGAFLEYGHCMNKCADALVYYKDNNEIYLSSWGVTIPKFAELCIASHGTIEDALGWDDIRDLDDLLQEASNIVRKGAKACSLAFPTADVPKHHVKPLSGTKSRIVSTRTINGETIYTTRRGVDYVMTPTGQLTKRI